MTGKRQDQLIRTLKRMDAKGMNPIDKMLAHAERFGIVPEELKERLNPESQSEFDQLVNEVLKQ